MLVSNLFSQTLRESPVEAESAGHKYLVRAGFIRQTANGIYSYLPLAKRALNNIENIMRKEIESIGGQEITMPVVNPAELWKETGRWYQIGTELGRFKDKNDRDMVLAMTHEEVVADLVRKEIHSYRQLPALIYHIQTKWRDDPRPRAGLIRVREFTMKDSYSLDTSYEGLDKQYEAHYQAYFNIFNRCGLPTIAVKADVGMMGGKVSHEFMYLNKIGEDTIMICEDCDYVANRQIAKFHKESLIGEKRPMEKVPTPDTVSIEDLCNLLNVTAKQTAKAIFMVGKFSNGEEETEKLVFAVVRGDMDLNETKLANAIKAKSLRPAHDEEIRAVGAVPGYASPANLRQKDITQKALIVVDDIIPESHNLLSGANEEGYHVYNVNYGRDYNADIVTDIAIAEEGYSCPICKQPMQAKRGIEVGNIFKLGTRYSDSLGCTFLDKDGKEKPVIMGSYGIGSGRLLASIAEEYNDDYGLIWPITIAPYHVSLVMLAKGDQTIIEKAQALYKTLENHGIKVLFDDREENPGVKFMDADLIGLPIRLTIGKRSLKSGGVELKLRRDKNIEIIPLDQVVDKVIETKAKLEDEIKRSVVQVDYKE